MHYLLADLWPLSVEKADVRGGGRGREKMKILADFQGFTVVTRGGRGSKSWKFWVMSFVNDPL